VAQASACAVLIFDGRNSAQAEACAAKSRIELSRGKPRPIRNGWKI